MAAPGEDVYCTLVMSDSYLPGAAVLAHSLRDAGTKKRLVALITPDTLTEDTVKELEKLYDELIRVERIRTPNPANLYLMDRADLAFTFTKLHLWRQTQFRKIVYLDADVVALRAPDELFELEASFAAAPDVGWPDCFNTGVMVISPNMGDYWALETLASAGDSFDGADQGLINQYYEHRGWHRLGFTYNCTPNAQYQWEPAYRHYKRDISMVHFIGRDKPWIKGRQSSGSGVYNELLGRWWATYDRHLKAPPQHLDNQHYEQNQGIVEQQTTQHDEQPTQHDDEPPPESDEESVADEPSPPQERAFSPPRMEWDATLSAPPRESRPEAANFPTQQYEFSESRALFQAPHSYPSPPRDMWYKVPQSKPKAEEAPRPIFPWEREQVRPKATRVFAEDLPPPPPPTSEPAHGFPARNEDASWDDFSQTSNAWDDVPGIESYIRAVMGNQQGRKAKPQGLILPSGPSSPTMIKQDRRESLILTDFPSEVERPSLPVTPAPIRRPVFWGEDKDAAEELPAAEGVPDQTEWVCPKCGFSSDNASAFLPHPPSPTSTITVVGGAQGPSPGLWPADASTTSESAKVRELGIPSIDSIAFTAVSAPLAAPPLAASLPAVAAAPPPPPQQPLSSSPPPPPATETLPPAPPSEPLSLHPPPSYHFHAPLQHRASSEKKGLITTLSMTSPPAIKGEGF